MLKVSQRNLEYNTFDRKGEDIPEGRNVSKVKYRIRELSSQKHSLAKQRRGKVNHSRQTPKTGFKRQAMESFKMPSKGI